MLEEQNTVYPMPGCDPSIFSDEKTPEENFMLCAAAVRRAIPGAKYGLGLKKADEMVRGIETHHCQDSILQ